MQPLSRDFFKDWILAILLLREGRSGAEGFETMVGDEVLSYLRAGFAGTGACPAPGEGAAMPAMQDFRPFSP